MCSTYFKYASLRFFSACGLVLFTSQYVLHQRLDMPFCLAKHGGIRCKMPCFACQEMAFCKLLGIRCFLGTVLPAGRMPAQHLVCAGLNMSLSCVQFCTLTLVLPEYDIVSSTRKLLGLSGMASCVW